MLIDCELTNKSDISLCDITLGASLATEDPPPDYDIRQYHLSNRAISLPQPCDNSIPYQYAVRSSPLPIDGRTEIRACVWSMEFNFLFLHL